MAAAVGATAAQSSSDTYRKDRIPFEYTQLDVKDTNVGTKVSLFKWLFYLVLLSISVTALVLAIHSEINAGKRSSPDGILNLVKCFIPVGGGRVSEGGALPQLQLTTESCISIFDRYFEEGGEYYKDVQAAIETAKFILKEDAEYRKMVVFDIDETSLSNLPYYKANDYVYFPEIFHGWVNQSTAPPLVAALDLYKQLREEGYSVTFLTGRRENQRNATETNLKGAGYGSKCEENPAPIGEICYYKLILRDNEHRDALIYKGEARTNLTREGFDIIMGVGDQWSDLLNTVRPPIVIKIPNPMYYIL